MVVRDRDRERLNAPLPARCPANPSSLGVQMHHLVWSLRSPPLSCASGTFTRFVQLATFAVFRTEYCLFRGVAWLPFVRSTLSRYRKKASLFSGCKCIPSSAGLRLPVSPANTSFLLRQSLKAARAVVRQSREGRETLALQSRGKVNLRVLQCT